MPGLLAVTGPARDAAGRGRRDTGARARRHLGVLQVRGLDRWPAVHRLDAAHLFRLAVEAAPAGTILHGVADEGVPLRDIAAVIGRHLDVPTVSVSAEGATDHFGFLGHFAGLDLAASSALTQQRVGWRPVQPGLLPDLDQGHYFN